MSINPRKLERILKDVNQDLEDDGFFKERLTMDIWTKLMSNLLQGEYILALPIRQQLHDQIRKSRPDKLYTFSKVILPLDEILNSYIPAPVFDKKETSEKQGRKSDSLKQRGKRKQTALPSKPILRPEYVPQAKNSFDLQHDDTLAKIERDVQCGTQVQSRQNTFLVTEKSDKIPENSSELKLDLRMKDDAVGISREQFFTMQANESVLMTTVEDQQLKIKELEKTVTMLEKRNMALKDEMKSMGTEKSDKIDVVKKAEKEMKFLKNELQIKEKSLQLSMIERNELLDRLSAVTSTNLRNEGSIMSELSYLNKPTQLSDKYSRLYETEWTDAFNILTLEMVDERIAIQWLLSILQDSYAFCADLNESHTQHICRCLLNPVDTTNGLKDVVRHRPCDVATKLITELKKATATEPISQIQVFARQMKATRKQCYEEKMVKKLDFYIDKCVELCWLMINQSPALCLDDSKVTTGDTFDRDAFRFYTKTGTKLDYIVWPPLYLSSSSGFLLVQGVAQPIQEGPGIRIASSYSLKHLT